MPHFWLTFLPFMSNTVGLLYGLKKRAVCVSKEGRCCRLRASAGGMEEGQAGKEIGYLYGYQPKNKDDRANLHYQRGDSKS